MPDTVLLDYGPGGLPFRIPTAFRDRTRVIRPRFPPALADPEAAIRAVLQRPHAGPPLRDRIGPGSRVAISVCDGTRAQPRRPMLRAILDELPTPPEQVTLLVATGTHRGNTAEELEAMFGRELLAACEVVNHDCRDRSQLVRRPDTGDGVPVWLDRRFMEADHRVTTGFVEPHFFAGFSGGPKMVAPGLAGLNTILALHNGPRIGHPDAVFGVTRGNPVHDPIREIAAGAGVDFALDVLLDGEKRITGVFGGDLAAEHEAAQEQSRSEAMRAVDSRFDVVVTTNSGHPLDQNLYQSIKGMSAAERIVRRGGLILCAAECRDGIPDDGAYARALRAGRDLAEVAGALAAAPRTRPDDWQVQVHCRIRERARVGLFSALAPETVRAVHLDPVEDLDRAAAEALEAAGPDARLAVLPHGPVTIPYVGRAGEGAEDPCRRER